MSARFYNLRQDIYTDCVLVNDDALGEVAGHGFTLWAKEGTSKVDDQSDPFLAGWNGLH